MPDSQVPPIWGPAYDERDLDALLSGETGSTPVALQPVEGTLAALRGAATRRELSDEAVARAAFRGVRARFADHWAAAMDGRGGARGRYLSYPCSSARPIGSSPRRGTGTGAGRPGSARKPGIAVTGAAAAALIVVATAVTGALTGSIGELTSFGRQPASASASARATGQSPGSEGVLVTGAARDRIPTPKTTVVRPALPRVRHRIPSSLCREYFEYFGHPAQGGRDGLEHASAGSWASWRAVRPRSAGTAFGTRTTRSGARAAWPPPGAYPGGARGGGRGRSGDRQPRRRKPRRGEPGSSRQRDERTGSERRSRGRGGSALIVTAAASRPGQASSASASRMTEQACSKAAS